MIEERGLNRYAIWFAAEEGIEMPNGEEEMSGTLVNEDGRVFSFWTGWDETAARVVFTKWKKVKPRAEWMERRAYRQARELAGVEPDPLGRLDRRRPTPSPPDRK